MHTRKTRLSQYFRRRAVNKAVDISAKRGRGDRNVLGTDYIHSEDIMVYGVESKQLEPQK